MALRFSGVLQHALGAVLVGVAASFDLAILHMNDHHSHLSEETWDLDFSNLDDNVTEGEYEIELMYGGYPRLKTLMDQREGLHSNVLRLHAGDAITGTSFFTLFKGDADARMMGLSCFDAFALGNHEFDEGDTTLANFLAALGSYNMSCPRTAVLAANVVPGPSSPLNGMLMNYTIKDFGGDKVGIIGIDTKVKTELSSSPDEGTYLLDEVTTIQSNVDMLTSMGINKIVLLTHVGFTTDSQVLAQLSGVDVIVGGDSHSLLWDAGSEVDFFGTPVGVYPTLLSTANGNVCVVQAWEYAHLLGELVVNFDEGGGVTSCTGMPLVPISDTVGGSIPPGEDNASIVAKLVAFGNFVVAAKDPDVAAALMNYSGQVEVLRTTVIGQASEDLCLERFPGQARSTICEVADTWQQGSDISCVVAKAFLHVTGTADMAIQNGGGVREDVAQGDISYNHAYAVLPFANTLWTLELTGQQVKDTLEEALEFALVDGSGAYPYAYGLRFDVNVNMTMGTRASNVEVNPRGMGSWMAINLTHTYTVVTNSFIASGRDGYTTFGVVFQDEAKVVDTYTEYATGFIAYTQEVGTVHKCSTLEYSTQSYTNAEGCLHVADGEVNCARTMLDTAAAFSLAILYLNDHHSHLEEETFDIDPHLLSTLVPAGTYEAEVTYGGYPRILKLMEMREAMYSNVAKLHAGDAITGTSFFTLFQGEADAELMGLACFDAFALGNHEFDSGDATLAEFLEAFKNYSAACSTAPAVVAANVVPGPNSPLNGALLNYTIKEYGADKVGFIGIDTKRKTEQSSSPDEGTYLIDEQAAAQYNIDMLKGMGVNKIVLVTHIGYEHDLALIEQLDGVDVVVGGDSHSLLLDHDGAVHFPIGNTAGTYPAIVDTANGKVCVVQAFWSVVAMIPSLQFVPTWVPVDSHVQAGAAYTPTLAPRDRQATAASRGRRGGAARAAAGSLIAAGLASCAPFLRSRRRCERGRVSRRIFWEERYRYLKPETRIAEAPAPVHKRYKLPGKVDGVRELVELYDGFTLDQYGVLHDGKAVYPGVVEALEFMRDAGKPSVILSNYAGRAEAQWERLPGIGLDPGLLSGIVTSGELAYQYLLRYQRKLGSRVLWIAWSDLEDRGLADYFEGLDGYTLATSVEEADFILVSGSQSIFAGTPEELLTNFERDGNPSSFARVFRRATQRALPMICANPDEKVVRPGNWLGFLGGALAKEYERLGGRVIYFGKPYTACFEKAFRMLDDAECGGERICHVGDSLYHDVRGAVNMGLDSAFVVETGLHARDIQGTGVAEVMEFCTKEEVQPPVHVMDRFAL